MKRDGCADGVCDEGLCAREPLVRDVPVNFRVWDVDHPFDQDNAATPDVQLIDDDTTGPDNRPSGEAPRSYTADTGADGRAVVTVEVSMQPGNNYRAAASCLADALTQVDQTDADTLSVRFDVPTQRYVQNGWFDGYKVPVVWSKMLTVWRKLHVETDSMVRPTFTQNTFTMNWNEPAQGPAPTQVVFDVDDPPADGAQTDHQQFTGGYVELADETGAPIVTARVVDYVRQGVGPLDGADDDEATINIPDCGDGQSGLACLGGVTSGTAVFSDDDLSVEATFTAKVWGCDVLYAGGGTALLRPDLSALELRYHPAYIDPVHETAVSALGSITTFLRNQQFGMLGDYGKAFWDQVKPTGVRNLGVSTSDFWTVMVVSAWQAEEAEDGDPDSETTTGTTLGINTHGNGTTMAIGTLGSSYTGLAAVFKALSMGPAETERTERFTVAHEIGHTFGLPHNDVHDEDPPMGLMDPQGPGQDLPFTGENLKRLREYNGP